MHPVQGVDYALQENDERNRVLALPECVQGVAGADIANGAMSIERAIDEHIMAKVAKLREMGFEDEALSKAALGQVGGNVNLAIEKIISGGLSAPQPVRDEPRPSGGTSSAASAPRSINSGGGGGLASIFNLSQRSSSVAHSSSAAALKPRSRPTAATSKPAPRPRSQSNGLTQTSMGILPLKRSSDTESPRGELPVCSSSPGAEDDGSRVCPEVREVRPVGSQDISDACSQGGDSKRQRPGEGSSSLGPGRRGKNSEDGIVQIVEGTRGSAEKKSVGPVSGAMPLAERMRPRCWDGFVGQQNVREVVDGLSSAPANLPSLILWGVYLYTGGWVCASIGDSVMVY